MTQLLVKEIVTKETKSISPDTVLPEAHQAMIMNNIRRLPVVRDDYTDGYSDAFRYSAGFAI